MTNKYPNFNRNSLGFELLLKNFVLQVRSELKLMNEQKYIYFEGI